MAGYTIVRSSGSTLTTVQDGTIDTTSTSLALPGRNYPGYGNALDTNFVRLVENFASSTPPANPIQGQIWFNTGANTLNYCPADGTTVASSWVTLTTTNSAGDTTLGNLNVTGNSIANNMTVNNATTSDTITVRLATVSANLAAANANLTVANIGTLTTQSITTGGATTTGSLVGTWTVTGNAIGTGLAVAQGNLSVVGNINFNGALYQNGTLYTPAGTFNQANVANYMSVQGAYAPSSEFSGNIPGVQTLTCVQLSGYNGTGTINGIWSLSSGARINATYADLAERFEADVPYDVGTVVELGGDKEITAVSEPLCDTIFGVVSDSAAYVMNNREGYTDQSHPAIAMSGRVPVKVIGKVKKGDRLVSAGKGMAMSAPKEQVTPFNTIGRALENKTTGGIGMVEAIVTVK